ncbi:kinase-like domain-containing protein [Boletus coccyginus]|nr:kinase-like domain-containing protein [Boletus coccyginus]
MTCTTRHQLMAHMHSPRRPASLQIAPSAALRLPCGSSSLDIPIVILTTKSTPSSRHQKSIRIQWPAPSMFSRLDPTASGRHSHRSLVHNQSRSNFFSSAFPPPPEDLTNGIVKLEDQYSEAGCFGDVYKCLYISSTGHKEVAVKAFRFKFRVDTSGMARRELGIWRRLDHPNIVPFLGIATGFGMIGSKSLVSLWMQNGTLESFLGDYKNLEIDHRLRLLLDIANGLCYLHSFPLCFSSSSSPDPKPIVHGDLNPANVLLDDKYTARLVDFGYASMVGEIPEALFYLKRSTRRPGALRWNAPEQVWSKSGEVQRTTESDVYSFGCIALQVLSGKPPWSELGEDVAVILQLSQGNTPSPPASRPIDAQYWELIERCLLPISERPAANIIVSAFEQFLKDFPPSKPLRDVIALLSSQNSQQSDASDSMFSTSFTCPGDEGIDKVWPDRDDQRISEISAVRTTPTSLTT